MRHRFDHQFIMRASSEPCKHPSYATSEAGCTQKLLAILLQSCCTSLMRLARILKRSACAGTSLDAVVVQDERLMGRYLVEYDHLRTSQTYSLDEMELIVIELNGLSTVQFLSHITLGYSSCAILPTELFFCSSRGWYFSRERRQRLRCLSSRS